MTDPERNNQNSPFTTGNTNLDPRTISIIAYLTLVGWIVAVVLNNPRSELASFHIRQSLGIFALTAAIGMVGWIPILGWLIALLGGLGAALLWILGILGAIREEQKPVPFLGEQFQEWFQAL